MLRRKRSPCNEKSAHCSCRVAPTGGHSRKGPRSDEDPAQPLKKKKVSKHLPPLDLSASRVPPVQAGLVPQASSCLPHLNTSSRSLFLQGHQRSPSFSDLLRSVGRQLWRRGESSGFKVRRFRCVFWPCHWTHQHEPRHSVSPLCAQCDH